MVVVRLAEIEARCLCQHKFWSDKYIHCCSHSTWTTSHQNESALSECIFCCLKWRRPFHNNKDSSIHSSVCPSPAKVPDFFESNTVLFQSRDRERGPTMQGGSNRKEQQVFLTSKQSYKTTIKFFPRQCKWKAANFLIFLIAINRRLKKLIVLQPYF